MTPNIDFHYRSENKRQKASWAYLDKTSLPTDLGGDFIVRQTSSREDGNLLPAGDGVHHINSGDTWIILTYCRIIIQLTSRTNGLTVPSKHRGARDNKFFVTHPMTDQRCLTSAITRRSTLTTRLSSSSARARAHLLE
jgi:hypothetical protein